MKKSNKEEKNDYSEITFKSHIIYIFAKKFMLWKNLYLFKYLVHLPRILSIETADIINTSHSIA